VSATREQEAGPHENGVAPLVEARELAKAYGHVQALREVNLAVWPGEIVGLIGDNGAGKSTLIRILSGVDRPDAGGLLIGGRTVILGSPQAAQRAGIETVYQDLSLGLHLDAAANVFMGRELLRRGPLGWIGVLDRRAMRARARACLSELGAVIADERAPVMSLSGGQRQTVAIARAVTWAHRLILLDEPTASLGVAQRERLHEAIRRIRGQGLAVIYVSHSMPDVLSVCDRVHVLRLGRSVADLPAAAASSEVLVSAMTGAAELAHRAKPAEGGQP
jgi:simple sugar transport system ATP-binding protein